MLHGKKESERVDVTYSIAVCGKWLEKYYDYCLWYVAVMLLLPLLLAAQ